MQIAIDDFGTGYSVLSHLKSLPVDTLKIDKSFVRELGPTPGDLAIVRAIIAWPRRSSLELVAEGVETEAAAQDVAASMAATGRRASCCRAPWQATRWKRSLPNGGSHCRFPQRPCADRRFEP